MIIFLVSSFYIDSIFFFQEKSYLYFFQFIDSFCISNMLVVLFEEIKREQEVERERNLYL